ncbi:PIK3CG [Symbiodinium sp. CCMP2592]|nr:PIK3CG [Symbiodinium sp. CCMP2592]
MAIRDAAKGLSAFACAMSETEFPKTRFLPGVLEIAQDGTWVDYKAVTVLKRFDSSSRPWLCKLHPFRGQEQPQVILKPEDLGREACIMQIASRCNSIWQANQVQCCGEVVYVKTYRIFPVGPDFGVVEAVPHATTIQKLKRDCPSGSRRRHRVHHFLQGNDGKLNRLAATTAGLLAMSYIIGLADGHGDNYMITTEGEYFRIDFEHTFGERPSGPDVPRLWLPLAVREALGERLDEVIDAAQLAVEVLFGLPSNYLWDLLQVLDMAFPEKESAVEYVTHLSVEEFQTEVQGVRSCTTVKCMKGMCRELGYGKPRWSRHHAKLNVKSPAALLCICRQRRLRHVSQAQELVDFAEALCSIGRLPRMVHVDDTFSLLSRLEAPSLLLSLIDAVNQTVSGASENTNMLAEGLESLVNWLCNAPMQQQEMLDEAAASMHVLDTNGALTDEQGAELFQRAEDMLACQQVAAVMQENNGLLTHQQVVELVQQAAEHPETELTQWLERHCSAGTFERLMQWHQLHVHNLEQAASVADNYSGSWLPGVLGLKCLKLLCWDRDVMGAVLPVAVHFFLPRIMAILPATMAATPGFLVSFALTNAFRMLPSLVRSQMLTHFLSKLHLQGHPEKDQVEMAYWQLGHRFLPSRLGQKDDFEAVSVAYMVCLALLDEPSREPME